MPKTKKRRKDGGASVHISPRTAAIVYDGQSLDDWDDDELLAGRKKNKNGTFTGRPPRLIPIEMHRELTKRRMQRAIGMMAYSLTDCVKMLYSVVNDEEALTADRIRAAEIMLDRILGKPTERVALDLAADGGDTPFAHLVKTAIVGNDVQARELQLAEVFEDAEDATVIEVQPVERAPKPRGKVRAARARTRGGRSGPKR